MSRTLWGVDGHMVALPLIMWIGTGHRADLVLTEYRGPTVDDLLDGLPERVAGFVEGIVGEATGANEDAAIDRKRFAAQIRGPLREALTSCADLTRADWVPTGRTMTVAEARERGAM